MDINPQRAAVAAARAADAGDFNHAGADSGAAVSLCRDAGGDQRHHRHLQRGQRSPRGGTHSALCPRQSLYPRPAAAKPQAIQPTIDEQKALLVVRFPADFSRNLDNYQTAPLQLLLDGRNSNSAQIAANYLQQIVKNYQQELLEGKAKPNNSELVVRNWYNPNLDYKWFVVPSLIAMITTIGVMIVTSLSVAREREQGTLDQLLVSPLATWQIFVGKAVPALIVATLQATIVLAIGIWAYQIPFAGSLLLFYFTMVIYGLSLVGFGLLISSLCATQQQAFIGVFVFMMPAILLSGYVSPVENMPQWLQDLTWINPIRHFTDITKQIYLKDASLEIVWGSLWPLLVIAATTGSAAYAMFRRKIA